MAAPSSAAGRAPRAADNENAARQHVTRLLQRAAQHVLQDLDQAGAHVEDLLVDAQRQLGDTVARVAERRIIGYHERIATRRPSEDERTTLDLGPFTPVLVFTRVTRTTTSPLGSLALAVRPDRFEANYLIDA